MRSRPTTLAQSLVSGWRGRAPSNPNHARLLSTTVFRSYQSRARLDIPPPFPIVKSCPDPSCNCPPTPHMPEGLPIDYDQPLNGTMAAYTQQILICTGQKDWSSRIEDDGHGQAWGSLVRGLKRLMGRGGPYLDPCNNVLVTNASVAPSTSNSDTASAFLFPSFKYIPSIPVEVLRSPDAVDLTTFVRAYLLPERLHGMHSSLPEDKRVDMTRDTRLASKFTGTVDIEHSPTVLICGHGGRDMRCGVMAPALESEFQRVLLSNGFETANNYGSMVDNPTHVNIGLISHIGGHKYAGNVIIYIPPKMKAGTSIEPHPLAGKGIWYGRVEPKHVKGIVDETILGGKVVTDHFRGGIDRKGDILRL